jgi:hypothetical protein
MRYAGIDASLYARVRQAATEGELINAAFSDILAGRFDSYVVHEALRLGHHEQHQQLREARDTAERVARAVAP